MRRLRIFTWHVHGSYLFYLSGLPHDLYVPVKPGRPPGYGGRTASYSWPDNVIEVPAEKVRDFEFDCVLYQSHDNWLVDQYEILSESQRRLPRVFLEHNTPKSTPSETRHPVDDPGVLLVHVTHFNELAWDNGPVPTRVIEHGVRVPEGIRSTYEVERGLVVINNLMSRGRRMGGDLFEKVRHEVPLDMIGMGWRDAGGIGEVPHQEIAAFHSRYRFHFSPVRFSSLALSLCEAMMIGQPVIGLATTELVTVIDNGVNGFVDTRLDSTVAFMRLLLRDKSLAETLGRAARKTAFERFHIGRFLGDWNETFAAVTGTPGSRHRRRTGRAPGERQVLRSKAAPGPGVSGARRLRIAMISEHASPVCRPGGVDAGGQNIYVGHVARQLARRGHQVDVFTRKDREESPEVIKLAKGLRVMNIQAGPATFVRKEELAPFMPEFTRRMENVCRSQRHPYDICHAHFWMSGLVASELKRRIDLPFVITFHALGKVRRMHQGESDQFPELRFASEERLVREADHVIAECPQDLQDLMEFYGTDPGRTTIVPCGFDPDEMYPIEKRAARRHIGVDPDTPHFLQLGRMVPRKGVDTVVRGFAHWLRRNPERKKARLLIVGGESETADCSATPEIGRLWRIAHEEGILENVVFVGRRDRQQLKYYYSAAEIFFTTPWYEPFGITPVEAMACGTPVIGTRVGGIKYSVTDGETGFLIEPNEPVQLAESMERMLATPGLREQMAKEAFARVQRSFRWEHVVDQIIEIYYNVVGAKAGVRSSPPIGRAVPDSFPLGAWRSLEAGRSLEARQSLEAVVPGVRGGDLGPAMLSQTLRKPTYFS